VKKSICRLYLLPVALLLILGSNVLNSRSHKNETIKIAIILPKTGVGVQDFQEMFNGARLAVDQINSKGGIFNRKIELIELDNMTTPIGSKNAAQKAVTQKVIAVIGCSRSSNSLAAAPVLQKAKIIMISPDSTNPKVTQVGNYIFRACFLDTMQGKIMANFARNNLKSKTAVVLTNTTHSYSIDLSKFFIKQYKKLGGKMLWQADYIENMSDYTNILKKVKKLKPNIIYLPGYITDSGLIMQQARKIGINSIFLGGDGWSSEIFNKGKDAVNGSYKTDHWFIGIDRRESKILVKKYRTQFKENPGAGAALTYDALSLLINAIKKSHSFNTEKIRKTLAVTKNFRGVTGKITFDKYRNPVKPAVIQKLMNNRFIFIKSVKP
jgi:branched-chain amino acid transport system substrate-binding protein